MTWTDVLIGGTAIATTAAVGTLAWVAWRWMTEGFRR